MLAGASGIAAAEGTQRTRTIRHVQDVAELGLTAQVAALSDGGFLVTASAAGLVVEKQVYADGTFVTRIAFGSDDHIVVSGEVGGVTVRANLEEAIALQPGHDADYEGKARRVRGWLARSAAVQRLRQITAALDERAVETPEALSLRTTGALLADLLGDPGAAQRFSRSVTAKAARRYRQAQSGGTGYGVSCWDTYHRLVVQAANQLESCIASFAVYSPWRQVCAAVWVLQVESAWFQFLACSSLLK